MFCQIDYGVSFPMHAKIDVNGNGTHAAFQQLKKAAPGLLGSKGIKWNFTKFLVAKDGTIVNRFAPQTQPKDIVKGFQAQP
ncbi:MAG: glutathione peroxidase [Cognaticolwellia sp.]|jgi:glutathione peroxidase